MEPENQPDGEIPARIGDHLKMQADTEEHPSDLSAFDVSIDREELEEAFTSPDESEDEPAKELEVQEIANYLDLEERERTFLDQLCEL